MGEIILGIFIGILFSMVVTITAQWFGAKMADRE